MWILSLIAAFATAGNAIIQFIEKDWGAGIGLVSGAVAFLAIALKLWDEDY